MSENDSETPRPDEATLVAALGATLFAAEEPVATKELAEAFGGVDSQQVEQALARLEVELARSGCGIRIERIAGGYRLATRPEVGAWVRLYFRQRNRTRLSPAALETLAIVAYRQPITAPEIQAIRGKDPAAALKGLVDRKLLRVLGRKKVVGNPLLYGTSRQFLVHFGLNGLEDLPSIEEFEEFVGTLEAGQSSLFSGGDETDAEAEVEWLEAHEEPRAPEA